MNNFDQTILGALIINAGGQLLAETIKSVGQRVVDFIKRKYHFDRQKISISQQEKILEIISQEKVKHKDDLKRDFVYNLDGFITNEKILSMYFDELYNFIKINIKEIRMIAETHLNQVNQFVNDNTINRDMNVAGRDNVINNY